VAIDQAAAKLPSTVVIVANANVQPYVTAILRTIIPSIAAADPDFDGAASDIKCAPLAEAECVTRAGVGQGAAVEYRLRAIAKVGYVVCCLILSIVASARVGQG
jgi:hypothetical protein